MIGAGHAGTTVALALFKAGHTFTQVYSRKIENAKILADKIHAPSAINDLKEIDTKATLYLFSLPDDHLEIAFSEIVTPFNKDQIAAHTSGSLPHNIFDKIAQNSGVLYFPQTMSKTDRISLEACPAIIQGSNEYTTATLKSIVSGITKNISLMDDNQRQFLHIAAIFSQNFTNYMYTIAEDICLKYNIDFPMLFNLIDQGVEKMKKNGPTNCQTGPAARNDQKIIERHLKLLQKLPEYQKIYSELSAMITARHKKNNI
jgi:predicted short-subunit dehydrogenase-like oxidoreductase (DUF2520 family)